jgi:hypothetical protein
MAGSNVRELIESPLYQGEDEIIVHIVDVSANGTPTSPVVVVKNASTGADVTATVMPTNSPTISGQTIVLSPLRNLTAGTLYRVEVRHVISGNTLENYFHVHGQV